MRRGLIVVESAYLAKAISRVLRESDYLSHFQCLATFGRLKDVIDCNKVDPFDIFEDRDILHNNVCDTLMSKEGHDVYIGTDSDIEGELIAYDIKSMMDIGRNNKIFRINIKEISLTGLEHSLSNPVNFDDHKVEACLARRGADIAIKQEYGHVGRVISRALSSIQSSRSQYQREELISEINLSPKNTVGVMVEMALQDIPPKEVSLSLQKLYSQGRVSYPRTLAGVPPTRNLLSHLEAHDPLVSLCTNKGAMHYDTHLDRDILKFLGDEPGNTAMSRYPAGPRDKRHINALLELYKMPFTRASTLGHHCHRLTSLMEKSSDGLSRQGWGLYHHAQVSQPLLCTEKGSGELNRILHLGDEDHKNRISNAMSLLSASSVSGDGRRSKFHYPDQPTTTPSPSLGE